MALKPKIALKSWSLVFFSCYRKAQRAAQVLEFPASLRGSKATKAISRNSRIPLLFTAATAKFKGQRKSRIP
nr:hypothetical protein [uncultured Campylobacter sp.]